MADVLGDLRKGLEKRLKELEPLVKEHAHVKNALDALGGAGTRTRRAAKAAAVKTTRAATRRTRPSANGAQPSGRGRPRGSGARAQEALKLVRAHPGITIGDMAKRMKIKPNYLYRVLPTLEKAGHIKKHEKGYHPHEGSTET